MKREELQQSEKLASYFAPRREEAPLLSTPDVEQLLASRAMLPNHPPAPSLKRRGSVNNISPFQGGG